MAVACEYTSNPHLVAPTTAGWAQITPVAGAWSNSLWVELLATTPGTGIAITGAIVQPRETIIDNPQSYEIELGTGVAASEVPIAVLSGSARSVANYGPDAALRPHGVPYQLAGGVRVSARLRKSVYQLGFEGIWGVGLCYYELPIVGRVTTTTSGQATEPAASVGVTVDMANVGLYTYGPWTTLSSGLAADSLLTGIEYNGDRTQLFELQIGIGSTPTVLTTIRNRISGGTSGKGGPANVDFFPPVSLLPASTPIQFRFRLDVTTIFSTIWGCKITYIPLPI